MTQDENSSAVCHCGDHCFKFVNKPFVALVSPEDKSTLDAFGWYADKNRHTYYMRCKTPDGRKRLHREIIKPATGMLVDHENGNGLDNRRPNLRSATRAQNCANRINSKPSRYGFIGVAKARRQWRATFSQNDYPVHVGFFKTAEAAARARDAAVFAAYGEFAKLNFPLETPGGSNV